MAWIIVIALVLIVFFVVSTQKDNKALEEHHLNQGGFRKSFETLTNHLENYYQMTFATDTGRSFSYSKTINDTNKNVGELIVGVRLNMRNEAVIYSKFKSKYKGEFLGIDVSGANYNDVESINSCINTSIDKLKIQGVIDYQDHKSKVIEHSASSQFIEQWKSLNKELAQSDLSIDLYSYINDFFIADLINPQKFQENLDILNNPWKGTDENYGTKSVRGIFYLPPLFTFFFVAAYPDVYNWYQENAPKGNIQIHNKLEKLSNDEMEEYFQNPHSTLNLYRHLINEYKDESNILETRI